MKYVVHWNIFNLPRNTTTFVGIEVQPGIAAKGIISLLTPKQKDGPNPNAHAHVADSVDVTQDGKEGTTFVITHNMLRAPIEVPLTIGKLIDPCGIHQVTYQPPIEPDVILEFQSKK